MYQQNVMNSQQTGTHAQHYHLNEQDTANLVLSELKRAAREYTTAALEATHPAIRQTFASLTQKTLQDQAELFDALSQINGYGSISMATQQEVQQELQQQIRRVEQLQQLVQRTIQSGYASANVQQQPMQQPYMQQQAYPSNQSFQQTGSYQTGYGSQGHSSSAASSYVTGGGFSSYPNQGYGSSGASGISQGIHSSHGFSSSSVDAQDSDYSLKSSVSGTDSQSEFAAKSVQDYTSNNFSSGGLQQEPYSSRTQQDQSYSSPGVSSSSARPSGLSHNSKYMM